MPDPDLSLRSEFLFDVELTVGPPREVGRTPLGLRRIVAVTGGNFSGPRLKGVVEPAPGGDWLLQRADGAFELDVRVTLRTDDDALVFMRYRGIRDAAPEVAARLAAGEAVDPSEYYFRTAPTFETASEKYAWLNRILAIGVGDRRPTGPAYRVHRIL